MPVLNKEELAKLKPEERIKKLKELEEASKKEIEEAKKLIEKSEQELAKDDIVRRVSVPQSRKIDISDLFEQPKSKLEKEAQEAKVEPTPEQVKYMVEQVYEEAAGLAYEENSKDKMARIDALGLKVEKIKYHGLTEEVVNKVVATRSLIYRIRKYHQPNW